MKKIILLVVITISMLIPVLAQSSPVMDSLNILLNQTKNEKEEINVLNEWVFLMLQNNNKTKAIEFANAALEKAKCINYQQGQVASLNRLGIINGEMGAREEVLKNLQESDDIYNKHIKMLEHQRKNQVYMLLGIIFFITILGSIAAFVAYRNRQQQLIAEYQADKAFLEKEQAYSRIDDLLITQELKMAHAKLAAKDETELRIAKDLHDRLGAMLSTIKLYFNDVNDQLKTVKSDMSPQYQKANELLDEACAEVRLIAHDMSSPVLKNFGLVESLKELMNTLNGSNQIKAKLYTYGLKKRLNNETERKIHKIILELVGNTLKHAKATKLTIQLTQLESDLHIMIEDNGLGFKPKEVEKNGGMGLRNITLKMAELDGRFHIDTGKGNGTTVDIYIPIKIETI